jgi:hypothetical protein
MATNVYFSQKVRSEQHLYEDIVIESLKMYGQDVYYLPRKVVSEDTILNEDIESVFEDAYIVEMYISNIDGFEGDGNLLSKFGVEIRDQANFIVAKKRWNQYIGLDNNSVSSIRPNEGDLIYLPLSKSLFEIRFVEHESPFYQLSNLPTYTLQCELFEYSGEKINTGIDDVDSINQAVSQQLVLVVNNSNGTEFSIGEDIQQEIGSTGEYVTGRIISYETVDSTTKKLFVTNWATTDGKYHAFTTTNVNGNTSGAVWDVNDIYNINDPVENRALPNDLQSRNQEFELEADGIIDFSESNPFGEIGG